MTTKLLAAIVSAGLAVAAAQTNSAAGLLQSARKLELVDGNLAGAIEGYKKALAAAKNDRAIAAKALLAIGECYRKQGNAEARRTFERLVREFADQPQAKEARTQLASLGEPPAAAGMRLQKMFDAGGDVCSSVSRDGKLLGCAVGWVNEIAVRDTAGGDMRVLTSFRKEKPAIRYVNTFAISPDGKSIAFQTYSLGGVKSELDVIPTDGSGPMRTVFQDAKLDWFDVLCWTPDGRDVLTVLDNKVTAVSVADGRRRVLREVNYSLQWVAVAYSPDGKWLAVSVPHAGERSLDVEIWSADGASTNRVLATSADEQVAGWSPDGKWLLVTTDADGPTTLLKIPIENGKASAAPQTVRTGMEHIRPLGIDAHGTLYHSVELRSSNIYTASFDAAGASLSGENALTNRAANRQAFAAWSPDGARVAWWTFSSQPTALSANNAQVLVRNLREGTETVATPSASFHAQKPPIWDADGRTLTILAPDSEPRSYRIAKLDPGTGKVSARGKPILIPNSGFMPEWSRDGRYLFQKTDGNQIVRRDLETGEEKPLFPNANNDTGLRELNLSPDGRRLAFFASARQMEKGIEVGRAARYIYIVDVETGAITRGETRQVGYAGGQLRWTPDGRWIVYSAAGLWVVPVDFSAPPRQLQGVKGDLSHIGFSPDGKTISYTRSKSDSEYWSLARFF